MKINRTVTFIGGPVALWVVAIVILPCIALLVRSVLPESADGNVSFENYTALANSRAAQQAFVRTLEISFWVTLLSIVSGYPLALSISTMGRRARGVFVAIVIFPFLLSAVVRAYGWNVILGDKGIINEGLMNAGLIDKPLELIHNSFAIIIGETHLLMPYMILSLLAVIQRIDPNLQAAAKSLGASPPIVFFRVILPMTLPGLLTGMLLVFSLAMTAFATPFLLGGTRSPLLTVLLYRYAFTLYDWSKAAAVGVVLLILGILFVILHRWASRRTLKGHEVAA